MVISRDEEVFQRLLYILLAVIWMTVVRRFPLLFNNANKFLNFCPWVFNSICILVNRFHFGSWILLWFTYALYLPHSPRLTITTDAR